MTNSLTERLEVRLDRPSMRLLREEARRRGVPMGELVRRAIERMLREDQDELRNAAESLFRVGAPVSDWDVMKREIETARLDGPG